MTHFPARRDALRGETRESNGHPVTGACSGCGNEFEASRPWQKQCSQGCRQRAYRNRQALLRSLSSAITSAVTGEYIPHLRNRTRV